MKNLTNEDEIKQWIKDYVKIVPSLNHAIITLNEKNEISIIKKLSVSKITVVVKVSKDTKKIPVKFDFVDGNFCIQLSSIEDLHFAPNEVTGGFDCSKNNLESLKGAPKKVGGMFNCSNNILGSLKYSPEVVNGDFDCSGNNLKSLKGITQNIKNVNCSKNQIESLKGAPSFCKVFDCGENKLKNLRGDLKEVESLFVCANDLETLEGLPIIKSSATFFSSWATKKEGNKRLINIIPKDCFKKLKNGTVSDAGLLMDLYEIGKREEVKKLTNKIKINVENLNKRKMVKI